jgi:hypothetical protein
MPEARQPPLVIPFQIALNDLGPDSLRVLGRDRRGRCHALSDVGEHFEHLVPHRHVGIVESRLGIRPDPERGEDLVDMLRERHAPIMWQRLAETLLAVLTGAIPRTSASDWILDTHV